METSKSCKLKSIKKSSNSFLGKNSVMVWQFWILYSYNLNFVRLSVYNVSFKMERKMSRTHQKEMFYLRTNRKKQETDCVWKVVQFK